jgi:hypothetical protein
MTWPAATARGKVMLRAAPAGTGIIAGGPMRAVFETLGMQDVVAKSMGSSNPYNMVRATFDALKQGDERPAPSRPAARTTPRSPRDGEARRRHAARIRVSGGRRDGQVAPAPRRHGPAGPLGPPAAPQRSRRRWSASA